MANFLKGDAVLFKVYNGSDYIPVICLTSSGLTESVTMIESQTKCNPGKVVKTPGSYNYEIPVEGEYGYDTGDVEQYDDLRIKLFNGDLVQWEIEGFFADGSTTNSYYGSGYFTEVSHDAPAGDEIVTFSANLVDDGVTDITQTNPNP